MGKVIGMVGSRRRDDLADFYMAKSAFVAVYEKGDTLVSGGCPRGGDRFAEIIAIQFVSDLPFERLWTLGTEARATLCETAPITIHRAEWRRLGKGAGFARNTRIAEDASILIALPAADRTGGTEDTIRKFQKLHPDRTVMIV